MGAPPKKKRHHFVPQFVLRGFSGDGASVPTLVLETGKLHPHASVRGQCAEEYLYGRESHMEDAFAASEGRVAAALRDLATGNMHAFAGEYRRLDFPESLAEFQKLQGHPLHAVREYVYYQTHRTLASTEALDEAMDAQAKRWLRSDPRILESPELLEALDLVTIKPTDTMGELLYSAGPFAFAMLDMSVKFLVAERPTFVLSDHPVVLRNQYAEVTPGGPGALAMVARGLQMFMPVSSTVTICVYDGAVYDVGPGNVLALSVSDRNARILNAMQVRSANECLYIHPETTVDLEQLRRDWQRRPDMRPRSVEGPLRDRGDGTLSQMVYTLPPEIEPLPRLRCFTVHDRTTETVVNKAGDVVSFPIRSAALAEAVERMEAVINWRVKESVMERGLPVDPERQRWLDSIKDPRRPGGPFDEGGRR